MTERTVAAYYNEWDKPTAQWLRELIKRGLIADGDVDDRNITEVGADDLKGYDQCHFFAGIGGWSYALRLAGWDDSRPVWTGSPPCQPFSTAGKRKGGADERHLWPVYFGLIAELRPAALFGEQVAAAIGNGWLDAVYADLEAEGYACAATVLPACSVGAPHIRQRLWFVANANSQPTGRIGGFVSRAEEKSERAREEHGRNANGLADGVENGGMANATDNRRKRGGYCGLRGQEATKEHKREVGNNSGAWDDLEWLPCLDGKARPTQPGLQPLAHGVSGRVGLLRGAGNAIVPQVAAQVIGAYLDALDE